MMESFYVFKNISRVMDAHLFMRWKIDIKMSFITPVYTYIDTYAYIYIYI